MIIYKFDYKCGLCHETSTAYTYIHYLHYYEDVRFPYENWMMDEVYAVTHEDKPYFDRKSDELNYPVKILGDDPVLDEEIVNSGRFPSIKKRESKFEASPYYANCCQNPSCPGMYGRYHLREYVTNNHLRTNMAMQIECEI